MHFRRRFYLKQKKRPLPFRYVLLISFTIFALLTVQGMIIIEKGIRPTLLNIATMETYKIATSTINYAVSTTIKNVNMNEFILIEKDAQDKITSIGYDSHIYNEIVAKSIANAHHYLTLMEQGKLEDLKIVNGKVKDDDSPDVLYSIPLGMATSNALLAQLGPLVPVKITSIGEVGVKLNEEIKQVGINNTWIRVSMDIEVQVQVIIPFATDIGVVSTTVPIGMIYVPGEVPEFYSGSERGLPAPSILVD